jgi:hypothetical protein
MQKKYLIRAQVIIFYIAVIIAIGLFLAFIYGVYNGLSTGSDIYQTSTFFRYLSDIVFIMGGAVLTFGAFVEFFIKARSPSLSRAMIMPFQVFTSLDAFKLKDMDASRMEETGSGGVTCIIIGAVIIIISLLFAFFLTN